MLSGFELYHRWVPLLLCYVYDRACLSYFSFSVFQRSVNFLGIVHLTTTTFSFSEQKYYLTNAKIATEIELKTLFHNSLQGDQ